MLAVLAAELSGPAAAGLTALTPRRRTGAGACVRYLSARREYLRYYAEQVSPSYPRQQPGSPQRRSRSA
jgi:hypothetical protein